MLKENRIWFIAFAALLIYILYLQQCKSGKVSNTNTIETIYKYDTVPHLFPVYYPQPQFVQLPSDTIRIPYTDTNYCKKIAMDYLATRYYSDTLRNDSVDMYIRSEVTNNKIVKQQGGYRLKFPITTTNIIQENRVKFYIGGNFGSDFKQNIFLGPTITLADKRDHLYHISAGFSPINGQVVYTFGMDFKIKFKRK